MSLVDYAKSANFISGVTDIQLQLGLNFPELIEAINDDPETAKLSREILGLLRDKQLYHALPAVAYVFSSLIYFIRSRNEDEKLQAEDS